MKLPLGNHLEGLFGLIPSIAPHPNHEILMARRSSTTSGGIDYVSEVLAFVSSRPPNTNIYAALITWINAKSATINPLWLSILTIFFFWAHVAMFVLAVSVMRSYIKMDERWLIRRYRNGLLKTNRVFIEAIGLASYAFISLIHMMYQFYTDINRAPARGNILFLWGRFPVILFCMWCITWGCLTGHIRAIWDPTFREGSDTGGSLMPKRVVNLLNAIFMMVAVLFLIALPASILPTHLTQDHILRDIFKARDELYSLSRGPDAMRFSLAKIAVILSPLVSLSSRIDAVAQSLRKAFYFLEVLDATLIFTYAVFCFLVYRQNQIFKNSQSAVKLFQDGAKSSKIENHRAELKTLLLEAFTILFVLNAYTPIFIWAATTRSDRDLVLSAATAIVPELTVGLVASFVGAIVMSKRDASSKRLLAAKVLKSQPQPNAHFDAVELRIKKNPETLDVPIYLTDDSSSSALSHQVMKVMERISEES